MAFEPIFQSFTSSETFIVSYKFANGAIIVVFAFLVPLLTMEINYFRLGVFRSWYLAERDKRRSRRRPSFDNESSHHSDEFVTREELAAHDIVNATTLSGDDPSNSQQHLEGDTSKSSSNVQNQSKTNQQTQLSNEQQDDDLSSLIDEETISSILLDSNILSNQLCDNSLLSSSNNQNRSTLSTSYSIIRKSSLLTITLWILLYLITAVGIVLNTRGVEEKVVAIIGGASKFVASVLVFIVSAKIPQWLGVYHQGSLMLVKHSSPYSQHLSNLNLSNPSDHVKLQKAVRRGVQYHFAKFYIILTPFYCCSTIPSVLFSMFLGSIVGFVLMWSVFMVHKKYIHHRNIVAFSTIFILIAISSLTFVRGMAWIQVVWQQDIFEDGDALLAISFFSWLMLLIFVHALFLWHTFKVEKKARVNEVGGVDDQEMNGASAQNLDESNRSSLRGGMKRRPSFVAGLPRKPSHPCQLFDPTTHFKDGKCCRFSELSEFSSSIDGGGSVSAELPSHRVSAKVEIEVAEGNTKDVSEEQNHSKNSNHEPETLFLSPNTTRRRCPTCCEVFACYSPEYKQSSLLWKGAVWTKIILITTTNLLFLYFVIVCIGATYQQDRTRDKLPYVHKTIYNHMNEGPVCAFDNRGPESNITNFPDADAAHQAGFLVLHCGACGACSNWQDLKLEWTTRDTISELANNCAKRGLFGGDESITDCLMDPSIGWGYDCAQCWMEDIVCTKDFCAFIFLQSQMINTVTDFAVGPEDITSATCEEANCEAGNPGTFVDCSGATRRRMNITSSIARPGDQQCAVVDVNDWEDLFFGSGFV